MKRSAILLSMKIEEKIFFSTKKSPYGVMLMAQSEKGLCALWLGDTVEELESSLHKTFPKATLTRKEMDISLDQLHSVKPYSLPLDMRGSPFQVKVWKELLNTKWGETITYKELAERIGKPKATRAVASACGKNQISLVIPCHRIIRKDGKASGYRFGVERKEKILKTEQSVSIP